MEVAVLDSAGLELQRSDWSREVPLAAARAGGATAIESFAFAAAPGRYRVRVRVVPDGAAALERAVEVQGFGTAPPISDLLLATGARMAASDSAALH